MGHDDSEGPRGGHARENLFNGVSIAQIVAGAGAAATSMVLASQIGIAGSVIGAAISSVVTVVCSQLYRRFLAASAEKLKDGAEALGLKDGAGSRPDSRAAIDGASTGPAAERHRRRDGAPASPAADRRGQAEESPTRIAPPSLQVRAAAERTRTQRQVALFSIVIAIAAVTLCAGAIILTTRGEGIGYKTEPIFRSAGQREPRSQGSGERETSPGTDSGGAASPDTDPTTSPNSATSPDSGNGANGSSDDSSGGSSDGAQPDSKGNSDDGGGAAGRNATGEAGSGAGARQ